uniref:Retrovirus-related Pol polyprotein from transposon TNT 1-94 n=1 Tax=Ananas comosus var. bracteatus TaxID=296719 RepID=A0A6V7PV06_ANACO|nr:unnamed protein product [Ananas comosus var. bracteatus]
MADDEWEEMDMKALATIRMCLADEVLFNIIGEKTAFGLWAKLESLYQNKSITNRIFLKRRLYSLRMKEGTKVSEHLNVFNNIICELESIGEKMKDEDKAITLLCTLPDSYETLITSLSCTKEDSLDLDTVCSALLADEL